VTWGPFFSPHISFGGAVAAAAFAAKKGLLESGKDISSALMGKSAIDIIYRRYLWAWVIWHLYANGFYLIYLISEDQMKVCCQY